MVRLISKKAVFSVSNILNPQSDAVLLEKDVQKSAYSLPGTMRFSVIAVKIKSDRENHITKLLATIAQNFSYVRKSYIPIQSLTFFTSNDPSLYGFLTEYSDSELSNSSLDIDGTPIPSLALAKEKILKSSEFDKIPENILSFQTFGPDYNFLFSPRYSGESRSIFSKLNKFFQVSFTETLDTDFRLRIPSGYSYLFIFPYATSPTPVTLSQTSSKISVGSILSFEIEEG